MPVQISVGPPVITINQGNTFMVTDRDGEICRDSEQGVFWNDTRFMSTYQITANGEPWTRLSSSPMTYYSARVYLTNQLMSTEAGDIPAGTLSLTITRAIEDGVHEDLDVANHNLFPVHFNLEVFFQADFADLFEVKQHKYVHRGRIDTAWDVQKGQLQAVYANRDFTRTLLYRVLSCDSPIHAANGRVVFDLELPPGGTWHACHHWAFRAGEEYSPPTPTCAFHHTATAIDQLQLDWQERTTTLESSNDDLVRAFRQSVEDMGALRLWDYNYSPDVWLPAAGVPWFVTLFGRDSLIVSLQNTLIEPGFVRGALKILADFQSTELDPYRDAEPGKILHELRRGELAHFKRIPHTPYYGTADATSLYLIALHEAWKWSGDDDLLREYHDVAMRCYRWIDRYGDFDDDGFQEYQTRSPLGYENLAWKDATDAVVYPDGSQVKQPKALCELQGYAYDAFIRLAEILETLGERDTVAIARKRAADLQRRFEEAFWCEDLGFYAFGLDPAKMPIKTIASNPGHCLFSGIASPEHAAKVVNRFLEPDLWSGWGIRTLSTQNPAYNPFSYQLGSVWPHDNGIIALGFKRYGFGKETAMVARDVIAAASYFVSYRLPELYAGCAREPGSFPAQYLAANVPQAWAAGSIFHFVQAMLGIQADAPHGRLYVDPDLPEWLGDVTLRGLKIGNSKLDLRFWRENGTTRWDVAAGDGDVKVEQKAMSPSPLVGARAAMKATA
jgi:glycogen debranching enzyme